MDLGSGDRSEARSLGSNCLKWVMCWFAAHTTDAWNIFIKGVEGGLFQLNGRMASSFIVRVARRAPTAVRLENLFKFGKNAARDPKQRLTTVMLATVPAVSSARSHATIASRVVPLSLLRSREF